MATITSLRHVARSGGLLQGWGPTAQGRVEAELAAPLLSWTAVSIPQESLCT